MIELPEAIVLADQLKGTLTGKQITCATADSSHHKFTWYNGNPEDYSELLEGRTIEDAVSYGGKVHIKMNGEVGLAFSDGATLSYFEPGAAVPDKHQLLLEFDDGSALVVTVRMYGGIFSYIGEMDNEYDRIAREAPDVFTDSFSFDYFMSLRPEKKKLSVKGFFATEQRIPGLGNGVAQDIMLEAGLHPKRDISTLSEEEFHRLYQVIPDLLWKMTEEGGRDTEKDLFGRNGGYLTQMSKNTYGGPCLNCGTYIQKEAFLGGVIYFCPNCQK